METEQETKTDVKQTGDSSQATVGRGDRLIQRILCVVLAIVFALLVGTGGYFIWYYTRDPAQRTLDWVRGMVGA